MVVADTRGDGAIFNEISVISKEQVENVITSGRRGNSLRKTEVAYQINKELIKSKGVLVARISKGIPVYIG